MAGRRIADASELHASDAQLSGRRIGQEFDVSDALFQLIERGQAAREQRAAVARRLDTPRTTIEKPDANCVLEVGDHVGDGGL